jgi:hypothetical protein
VALRISPATALNLDGTDGPASIELASGQTQLETLASIFRSDQLAWKVITSEKLYQAPGFMGRFAHRFPGFRADAAGADAQAYLLERFQQRLNVRTLPSTLILQIRFRSKDPALSAAVVNAVIRAYSQQEADSRLQATAEATGWLDNQLKDLKMRVEGDERRLADFQKEHGLVNTPETLANGQPTDVQHTPALLEIDELGRELVAATADRIALPWRAIRNWCWLLIPGCKARTAVSAGHCSSSFMRATVNLNRNRLSSVVNMAQTFLAWLRFAISCRIWTSRYKPRTPSSWTDSAMPGRQPPIVNNWCARAWTQARAKG